MSSGYVLYVSLAFLTCQTAMASSLGLCVAICHHCQIQQQNKALQFVRPREHNNKTRFQPLPSMKKLWTKSDSWPKFLRGSCILGLGLVWVRFRVSVSVGGRVRASLGGSFRVRISVRFWLGLGT